MGLEPGCWQASFREFILDAVSDFARKGEMRTVGSVAVSDVLKAILDADGSAGWGGRHVGSVDDQEFIVHEADGGVSVIVDGIYFNTQADEDAAARVSVVVWIEGVSNVV